MTTPLRVPYNSKNFLTSWETVRFSPRIMFSGAQERGTCDFRTVRVTAGNRRRISPAVTRSKLHTQSIQCHGAGAYCSLPRSIYLSSDTVYGICEVGEMYAWRKGSDALATSFPTRDFNSPIPAFDIHVQMTQNKVDWKAEFNKGLGGGGGRKDFLHPNSWSWSKYKIFLRCT